jgi:hypothetical protein
MTFYFAMINAWSLAWDVLNGTMDEEYPIIDTKLGVGNTAHENDGLDYESDLYDDCSADYLADIDDQRAHHFGSVTLYDDYDTDMNLTINGETEMDQDFYEPKRNHQYKYHEDEILKDIQEYVSSTYNGHYTGTKNEFRKVQTIRS